MLSEAISYFLGWLVLFTGFRMTGDKHFSTTWSN